MTGRDAAVRASTLALLFLVSVALAIAAADLRNGADRIGLDPSWAIDLENQWLQGRVSGRDFFFTYGRWRSGSRSSVACGVTAPRRSTAGCGRR